MFFISYNYVYVSELEIDCYTIPTIKWNIAKFFIGQTINIFT